MLACTLYGYPRYPSKANLGTVKGNAGEPEDSMNLLVGFLVAFGIGAFCRLTKIPSPAPQAILGSLLVVAMSVGYVAAGRVIDHLQLHTAAQQASSVVKEKKHASHPVQSFR
jgi:XapX domain-containing protein